MAEEKWIRLKWREEKKTISLTLFFLYLDKFTSSFVSRVGRCNDSSIAVNKMMVSFACEY